MGRQENIEIFENTMSMCRIDPFLRSAIKESSGAQSLIPEGDWVELPMIQKGAAAKVVVSRKRTLEAAAGYARAGKRVCVLNFASAPTQAAELRTAPQRRRRRYAAARRCT